MKNKEIVELGQKYLMNTYGRFPIALVKGEGSRVWDADGKEYIDFVSGLAVTSLGHANPYIAEVLNQQAKEILHSSNLYWIKPQVKLAQKLVENSCFHKVFFANGGAEANEVAIKLARKYSNLNYGPGRYEIITMKKSFHGRTMATLTATGQEKVQIGYEPLLEGFKYVPFNDFPALEEAITEKTCAIMVEPVQGEGGVNPAKKGYLKKLEALCKDKDILLIVDEVQTGMGRTGKLFAYEHYGIEPDIMSLAKALGNGTAISATLATDKVAQSFKPGDHASTFGGNFLACAVGNMVMDLLLEGDLLAQVEEKGEYLKEKLNQLKEDYPIIVEARGMGFLVGVEIKGESVSVVRKALENGLLLSAAGPKVVRFLPALNTDKETLDEAVEIFKRTIKAL